MGSINVVRGFLAVAASSAGVLFVSILITPFLVRMLGPSGYGAFAFMVAVYGVLNMVASPGISTGVRKYVAEDPDDEHWSGHVFGFYFRLGVLMVATLGGVLVFASAAGWLQYASVPAEYVPYFYVVVGWLVFEQLFSLGKNTLRAFGLEHYSDPLLVVQNALYGAVGLGLVYYGFGVTGALFGKIVAAATVTVVAFALVSRRIPLRSVIRRPPSDFPRRELLTFNAVNIVLLLMLTSLYQLDVLLLGALVGSEQTGYYRAALTIAEFVWFVPFALQTVLLHSTSEVWSRGERERVTQLATRATRYGLLLTGLLALGLVALADRFVPLYFGSEFAVAVGPLLVLLPGAVGFAVARPIFAIGQGTGELRTLVYATGSAAGINLVLNLLLIPRYGTYGAAFATSVGYGSMLVMHVASARSIGFDPLDDVRLARVVATAVLAAPVILGLGAVIGPDLLALTVVPPVGFAVFATLAYATGAIDVREVEQFADGLPEPVSSVVATIGERVGVGKPT